MSERAALHRTIFLSIVIGVIVGVAVSKVMDGWPRAMADGENGGRQQFVQQAETFRQAAKKIGPAVVAVTTLKKVQKVVGATLERGRDAFGFLRYYRRPKVRESLEIIGIGSGFIFDAKNGYILTNNHVVQSGEEWTVRLGDKRELSARLVGRDPQTDIAVLQVEAEDLPQATLGDSDAAQVGDWVLAAGNPFGLLEQTITAGIISAKGRKGLRLNNYEDFLQTDAAINRGNSGGPLVDLNGHVVGINTAIYSESGGYQGIGFAIPINQAREIAAKLVEGGKVVRGWMGVEMQSLDARKAQVLSLAEGEGMEISGVYTNGPAHQAGLWPGDVVVEIDGQPLKVSDEVGTLIAEKAPNEQVALKIMRLKGQEYVPMDIPVTLSAQPENWNPKK